MAAERRRIRWRWAASLRMPVARPSSTATTPRPRGGRRRSSPSVRACGSLAEWTEAAKGFGIDLRGREAQFVDNTCNAAGDDVKSLRICQEAKAAVSDPRRVP